MPDFEINIKMPLASNSVTEVIKATASFATELEALKQKLPENAVYKDSITGARPPSTAPRKTLAARVAEGVAAELAKRDADTPPRRGIHAA